MEASEYINKKTELVDHTRGNSAFPRSKPLFYDFTESSIYCRAKVFPAKKCSDPKTAAVGVGVSEDKVFGDYMCLRRR